MTALKKSDINSFLDKIQSEAVHSISKEFTDKINIEKENIYKSLTHQGRTVEALIYEYATYCFFRDVFSERIKKASKDFYTGYMFSSPSYPDADLERYVREIENKFIGNLTNDAVRKLNTEMQEKMDKTRRAYNTVRAEIAGKKVPATLAYLKAVGFDIDKIQPVVEVDNTKISKKSLFPCLKEEE